MLHDAKPSKKLDGHLEGRATILTPEALSDAMNVVEMIRTRLPIAHYDALSALERGLDWVRAENPVGTKIKHEGARDLRHLDLRLGRVVIAIVYEKRADSVVVAHLSCRWDERRVTFDIGDLLAASEPPVGNGYLRENPTDLRSGGKATL